LMGMLCTGCSMHFTVPDADVAVRPPEHPEKMPLKAAILIPDENLTETRTLHLGVSQTYTIPAGKMVQRASREVSPHYFEKAAVVRNPKEAAGFDLVLVPAITDFGAEARLEGLSTNHIKGRVSLRMAVSDPRGGMLWEKTLTSPWIAKVYTGLSMDAWLGHYGMILAEATATAMKDALRQLSMSLEFQDLVAATGGRTETGPPAAPQAPAPREAVESPQAPPADSGIARKRLKAALEKGLITADQVSRAMEELKSPRSSKTLEAFLQGQIDGKQFGELY